MGLHVPLGACSLVCSILDLLVFNPDFSTFISLIKAAGLVDLLSQPGPMTLFAPTNAAFDALPPPTFTALVSDKIALQVMMAMDMTMAIMTMMATTTTTTTTTMIITSC